MGGPVVASESRSGSADSDRLHPGSADHVQDCVLDDNCKNPQPSAGLDYCEKPGERQEYFRSPSPNVEKLSRYSKGFNAGRSSPFLHYGEDLFDRGIIKDPRMVDMGMIWATKYPTNKA